MRNRSGRLRTSTTPSMLIHLRQGRRHWLAPGSKPPRASACRRCAHRACRTDTWFCLAFLPSSVSVERGAAQFQTAPRLSPVRASTPLVPSWNSSLSIALPSSDLGSFCIRAPWLHDHYSLPGYYGPLPTPAPSPPVMDCRDENWPRAPCLQTRVSRFLV